MMSKLDSNEDTGLDNSELLIHLKWFISFKTEPFKAFRNTSLSISKENFSHVVLKLPIFRKR